MTDLLARFAMILDGAWRDAGATIGDLRWSFAPGGRTLLVVGLIVAFMLVILCYYRTTEGLSRPSRLVLGTLRWTALASLLIMAAGTICSVNLVDDQKPNIILAIDDSPSMGLPLGDSTRLKSVEAALEGGLLERLEEGYNVHVVRTSGIEGSQSTLPQSLSRQLVKAAAQPAD